MCFGLVGRVVEMVDLERHVAEVDVRGVRRRVNTALLDGHPLEPGAYVLINLGMAVDRLEEHDALEHLRFFDELEAGFTAEEAPAG
jgi:hydrogenase expression/formation protein HypC